MNERQKELLFQIVKYFIETAEPIGSKALASDVSSATIRNDMASLEKNGMIVKLHTSSGRVPTAKGFKIFVDEYVNNNNFVFTVSDSNISKPNTDIYEQIKKAVSDLANGTNMLSFATTNTQDVFYLGMSYLLQQPEYKQDGIGASEIAKMLENSQIFCNFINSLDISNNIKVFIGAETKLNFANEISIIVVKWYKNNNSGTIGILGPVRMPYIEILKELKKIVEFYGLVGEPLRLDEARGMFLSSGE